MLEESERQLHWLYRTAVRAGELALRRELSRGRNTPSSIWAWMSVMIRRYTATPPAGGFSVGDNTLGILGRPCCFGQRTDSFFPAARPAAFRFSTHPQQSGNRILGQEPGRTSAFP